MNAAAREKRREPLGYGIVLLSYLGMAGSAPLVAWAGAPEAIILTLRMAFAALALGVVFLRRPMIADWRRPDPGRRASLRAVRPRRGRSLAGRGRRAGAAVMTGGGS